MSCAKLPLFALLVASVVVLVVSSVNAAPDQSGRRSARLHDVVPRPPSMAPAMVGGHGDGQGGPGFIPGPPWHF